MVTNQTDMTDYNILGKQFSFSRPSCKTKAYINQRLQKRLYIENFHHFGTVFVKRWETGKVVQKPSLFMQQSRSMRLDSCSICDYVT